MSCVCVTRREAFEMREKSLLSAMTVQGLAVGMVARYAPLIGCFSQDYCIFLTRIRFEALADAILHSVLIQFNLAKSPSD